VLQFVAVSPARSNTFTERICPSAKELSVSAKEPSVSAKEPSVSAKEPSVSAKEPYIYRPPLQPYFNALGSIYVEVYICMG